MFVIEQTSEISPKGSDKRVIDHESGVWIQPVGGHGREEGLAFRMWYQARWLFFDTRPEFVEGGQGNTQIDRMPGFGSSVSAYFATGLRPGIVDKPALEDATRLAAEALLVFGTNFNGQKFPLDYHQVELNVERRTEILSRRDFPYMVEATESYIALNPPKF